MDKREMLLEMAKRPHEILCSEIDQYPALKAMVGFDQENIYHSMSLLQHVLKVAHVVCQINKKDEVRVAALYHDCGKVKTKEYNPEKGTHTFYGHDKVGVEIARSELTDIGFDKSFVEDVCLLISLHMRPLGYINQPFGARGVRRLINKAQGRNVDINDLLDLNIGDIRAHDPAKIDKTLEGHNKLRNHISRVK